MFDDDRYFDVFAEYAKAAPDDLLIRITVANRGPEAAALHVLPTLWFRNTWSWGRERRGLLAEAAHRARPATARVTHRARGARRSGSCVDAADGAPPALLFTENETNVARLFGAPNADAVREGRLPRVRRATAAPTR